MRNPDVTVPGAAFAAALALVATLVLPLGPTARREPAAEDRKPARITAYPDTLPESPGREIAEQSCLSCHTAPLLTQQEKDSTAWTKTLVQMEKWGAPVAPAQRDSLLGYLVRALGPR